MDLIHRAAASSCWPAICSDRGSIPLWALRRQGFEDREVKVHRSRQQPFPTFSTPALFDSR